MLTQLELERVLEEDKNEYGKIKSVVMIQCVGSRDDDHPYCSTVCPSGAMEQLGYSEEKILELVNFSLVNL